jgi:hypothetical protein
MVNNFPIEIVQPEFLFLVHTPDIFRKNGKVNSQGRQTRARAHATRVNNLKKHRGWVMTAESGSSNFRAGFCHPGSEANYRSSCTQRLDRKVEFQTWERQLTPLRPPIDHLPGIPHHASPAFAEAADFRESRELTCQIRATRELTIQPMLTPRSRDQSSIYSRSTFPGLWSAKYVWTCKSRYGY